ncbi:1-acyl-sn-glycerol-3-phosphate acyltransferase alpha [Pogona vitticeps]
MEQYQWILSLLAVLLIGVSLLYQWSTTFNFYCKMALFHGWIILMATVLSPVVAVINGRNVENMKVLRLCIKPLKYFCGIKITVKGSENLNIKEPYVIVSNHQSCIDLLGMAEVIPDGCVTIAKKELLYLGPIGWAVWICGLIFIDRKKKREAMATMDGIAETMRQDDIKIWVYPEGTRNQENTMLPFRRGAFHLALKAQVPIIPIVTCSLMATYNYKEKMFSPGHWTIQILPKIETKGLRVEDAMALAESTRHLMQDTFCEISRDVCRDTRQ